MKRLHLTLTALLFSLSLYTSTVANETFSNFMNFIRDGRSVVIESTTGQKLRLTPYGNYILRVQAVRSGEAFLSDDHYEMVESHDWQGNARVSDRNEYVRIECAFDNGVVVDVQKKPMRISFHPKKNSTPLLKEEVGISWEGNKITERFLFDDAEHFTGLGHGYFGRANSIDLKGQNIERNYGSEHSQQAALIVPFFLSSKGYGIFLNSTFPNAFSFGKDGAYEFGIDDLGFDGRMDYFFILGPSFPSILDRYTQLTGRPRLPPLAMFGLALSDKGHDHTSPTPSDENWWKQKIKEHRNAGFALDHVVNDNRWRAGGGKRCESYFAWDSIRYPDPREYKRWLDANGLVTTLDLNRCISRWSEGWNPAFNIPITDSIEFKESAPDLTRKEVRSWFWNLFFHKSLDPTMSFPGDALWIDEFDEMGKAPMSMILGNKKSWAEMKNYWFFLIAKGLVQEGWDRDIAESKRPFVWVRGMTAGAQRFATLWSGDIRPTYEDMELQIRGMQLAGISGFPYWGHDAGGFHDWASNKGPDDNMYRQWSMAFGSFTPFWRPHGVGQSRWPLDRPLEVLHDAKTYCELRYKLMPYIYTYAHEAHATGVPMARAMVIDNQYNPLAWKHDLQYMWGREMLVAPNPSDSGSVSVWLPDGVWYDFWNDAQLTGNRIIDYPAPTGKLPLFVKAGSIIPMAPPALSTAFIAKDSVILHVYAGADGSFMLYEDDGISERFRFNNEKRTTQISFSQRDTILTINPSKGNYRNAPRSRWYRVEMHGLEKPICVSVNGDVAASKGKTSRVLWDEEKQLLSVIVDAARVNQTTRIKLTNCEQGLPR